MVYMSENEIEEVFRKLRVKEFTFKVGNERVIAHADVFLVEVGNRGKTNIKELAETLKYPKELVEEVIKFLKDLGLVRYCGELSEETTIELTDVGLELKSKIEKEREESLESLSSALESGLFG